ncbi:MAG: hypothetical protein HYZ84_06905 [Candidatus Omnitrophica bacterium]|nr:hypothetical protein [Candidatus Omnitrophota bacterium]
MKRFNPVWMLIVMAALSVLPGCFSPGFQQAVLYKYDKVLTYDLSYDLVYLRTLEAVENLAGWELEETEKEKGVIRVRNTDYKKIGDFDQQLVTLEIARVSANQTTIRLAEDSQHVIGADKLLDVIGLFLDKES